MASKLLRMLRLPRLLRFIKLSTFMGLVDFCLLYSSRNDKLITRHICLFAIRIFRTLLFTLILTYFLGCVWHFLCLDFNSSSSDTFISEYLIPEVTIGGPSLTNFEKLVYCCYFVLTTVATTGYGDLSPQSSIERIYAVLLMLAGVAFYSLVIGEFINIIEIFDKKLYVIDKGLGLHAWLTAMQSFTATRPLPKKLIRAIDSHFQFFWRHERTLWLQENDKLLNAMPSSTSEGLLALPLDGPSSLIQRLPPHRQTRRIGVPRGLRSLSPASVVRSRHSLIRRNGGRT